MTFGTPGEIPAAVRELAEDGNAVAPLGPGQERIVDRRFALRIGTSPEPPFNVVCRVRMTAEEVEGAIAEVRSLLGARGHRGQWEVGSSSTPVDLAERLIAHGIEPDPDEPVAGAMVLMEPPKVILRPGIVVRPARTPEEAATAKEILWRCFMGEDPWTDERRAAAAAEAAAAPPDERNTTYLAWIDGAPVAAAGASFCDAGVIMAGGATLPEARGRGAYGALVVAPWEAAVARGTPALVTHAGSMSRPILERVGFVAAAEVWFLNDAAPP